MIQRRLQLDQPDRRGVLQRPAARRPPRLGPTSEADDGRTPVRRLPAVTGTDRKSGQRPSNSGARRSMKLRRPSWKSFVRHQRAELEQDVLGVRAEVLVHPGAEQALHRLDGERRVGGDLAGPVAGEVHEASSGATSLTMP